MQMALTIEEARTATGLSRGKIYEYINSGELKARKLGKRTLILKTDLEAFLSGLKTYAPQKQAVEK